MSGAQAAARRRAMLCTAMGPRIASALADPLVIEVMVNPDGALRLDRLGSGRCDTGVFLEAARVERIIRLVASHAGTEAHPAAPIVSAELPPMARTRPANVSRAFSHRSSRAPAFRSANRRAGSTRLQIM